MAERVDELWKYAPVVAVLILVLWAGYKGWWYWGPGMRTLIEKLEQQRDEWKRIALGLMEKNKNKSNGDDKNSPEKTERK
jgi:hypothetical protein